MGKKVSMLLHFALDSCCVWRHVAFHYFATLFCTDLALCGHRTSYCDFASALLWLQNLKHLPPVSCLLAWIQLYYRTLVLRTFHQQARTWRRVPRVQCVCVLSAGMFVQRACSFSTAIFRLPLCPPAPLVYGSETQGDTKTQFSILYPHMVRVCACWSRHNESVGTKHIFTRSKVV